MAEPMVKRNELLEYLNREVYGQKWAKEKLVDALVWNQERLRLLREGCPASDLPAKANVLFIGPTGCGKTFLVAKAAKFCQLPYYFTSATEYSAAGYVGRNVVDMVTGLLEAAGRSGVTAERGIIFIDEVDKSRRRQLSGQDDVGGESVQHALLTMLEGTVVASGLVSVDTSGITFVASGAFSAFSDRIGPEGERQIPAEQLIKFGMIPEFVGRFSVRVGLAPLTAEDLRRLLLECHSSTLWRTKNLFERHGIELVWHDAVIDSFIAKAHRMGTGARALDEMVKDRCLGLMSRVSDLASKGVGRVELRENDTLEHKAQRFRQGDRRETAPVTTGGGEPVHPGGPVREVPPDPGLAQPPTSDQDIPTSSSLTTDQRFADEAVAEQVPTPPRAWLTIALVIVLLALGIAAFRYSPPHRGQGSGRPAEKPGIERNESPRP